ncbi:hypothetical protein J2T56_001094 [Natronobacillus azotifigens]|uniref:Uncharacterized protein n=1 Tax=Natronobacillus azotifigens TaxID=472978 RepID=A0A9J6RAS3_9BACI|nr:hypothetical protein [Natronobacillus azotifigens]MCZ0702760.1 hypothetical protein [Natronobacillus azotifigens]
MSLSDLPAIKPTKGALFLSATALATMVFFYTQRKENDLKSSKK